MKSQLKESTLWNQLPEKNMTPVVGKLVQYCYDFSFPTWVSNIFNVNYLQTRRRYFKTTTMTTVGKWKLHSWSGQDLMIKSSFLAVVKLIVHTFLRIKILFKSHLFILPQLALEKRSSTGNYRIS